MKQVILSWRCIITVLGSLLTLGGTAMAQDLHRIAYWRTHYQELLPQSDPRAARAHEIFAQILQVAGTPRGVVPRLLVLKEDPWGIPLPVALQDGWIVASKGVLDFCYRVPRLGDDRLAFVLGHELAHLVQDHFWHLKFFQAMQAPSDQVKPQSAQLSLPPENLQHQELQADTNGMIYAAMAGFNPQAIVTRDHAVNFFQEWIESREPNRIGRRPDAASHPTSQRRAEALTAALQRVVNQTVAFQIGLWLTYAGDYEQAIQAFEYFLELFPSREVYHNLGLSHHQLALQAYQVWKPHTPILPFHLPLILDPVTRASQIYLSAQAQRSGGQAAPQEVFRQHLEKAIERYRQAMEQNHGYLPSAINLANAFIIRGVQSKGRGLFNADFVEAQAALATWSGSWRYHQVASTELVEHKRYAGKGRPSAKSPIKAIEWQIQAEVRPDTEAIRLRKQHKGCFVLGTTIAAEDLSDQEVITAYKAQSQVEGGFRFLKDPLFFVSSLFVKKPTRIQGLLMVMTLALLVYSVAQRRLRQALGRQNESLPNQIKQPTQRPTLRWVFQLLEGIHRVRVIVQDQVHDLIEGLNEVQIKILRMFGQEVCQIYQISSG
jgi:tetratricopeptide (TPR) repeat protein